MPSVGIIGITLHEINANNALIGGGLRPAVDRYQLLRSRFKHRNICIYHINMICGTLTVPLFLTALPRLFVFTVRLFAFRLISCFERFNSIHLVFSLDRRGGRIVQSTRQFAFTAIRQLQCLVILL